VVHTKAKQFEKFESEKKVLFLVDETKKVQKVGTCLRREKQGK
jgi:hypothetical protein